MVEGPMILLAGSASGALLAAIQRPAHLRAGACTIQRFPDGEVSVRLDEPVRGSEVILLAATAPPVNDHLVELLALADACRRADAARVVAIMPYFGYARSDRRNGERAPIMARLVADLAEHAGIDHVVTVDVHTPAVEGFFRIPVDNLTAIPSIAAACRAAASSAHGEMVIVAPDLGAVRLANRYATELDLPVAVCNKRRAGGADVAIRRITGDVARKRCIIVDDMISTGSTIVETVRALNDAGAGPEHTVAATHALLVHGSLEKMASAGVRELFVTDTIAQQRVPSAALEPHIVSIAPLLSLAIGRIVDGGSLRELA